MTALRALFMKPLGRSGLHGLLGCWSGWGFGPVPGMEDCLFEGAVMCVDVWLRLADYFCLR